MGQQKILKETNTLQKSAMNALNNKSVPYYDHFLFKESIDLKNSLLQSSKKYKITSKQVKELLKSLYKLQSVEANEETLDVVRNYKSGLELFLIELKGLDDTLFDLQKNLQSNRVYDEDYQKLVRIECKSVLFLMQNLQEEMEPYLQEINHLLEQASQTGILEKSSYSSYIDWILNIQSLIIPEKRLIR